MMTTNPGTHTLKNRLSILGQEPLAAPFQIIISKGPVFAQSNSQLL